MLQLINSLNVLLPLIYGASFGLYAVYFFTHRKTIGDYAARILLTGIIVHLVMLVANGVYYRFFPIASSFGSLSMLELLI